MTIKSTSETDTKNTTMAGNKRRRGTDGAEGDIGDEKTAQTSKCKGATTIPIFLKSKFECFDNLSRLNVSMEGYVLS